MLHIRQSAASPVSDAVLRSMFAARKAIFVDLLKWDVPVIDDKYEMDQFDDEHATYLVLAAPDGTHLGSARLLPTSRPHILGSLYAGLCQKQPPQAANIFEITRFCLDRGLSARERRAVRDTLVVALVEHALTAGICAYSAIAEMGWFQQILTFGWRCRPLGVPQVIGQTTLAALYIEIDRTTPSLLAAAGIHAAPAIRRGRRLAA